MHRVEREDQAETNECDQTLHDQAGVVAVLALDCDSRYGKTNRVQRTAAAVDFSSTCGKMMVDSRKGLDETGLFRSYLGEVPAPSGNSAVTQFFNKLLIVNIL